MRGAVIAKSIAGSGKKKNAPRKKHADEPDDEDDDSDYVGDSEDDEEEDDEKREAVEMQEEAEEVLSKGIYNLIGIQLVYVVTTLLTYTFYRVSGDIEDIGGYVWTEKKPVTVAKKP
ncbi:hypothetical protein PR001_g4640 [Phytophthora rubi]|uniref:Uncharacterized protein n=1 Tax=Phytophthora rubi TaxID=129364 RepID=A0A6A3NSN8_9STRA|nr:hypothetical protein PR002_g7305 [Phytophthora rubi]KAE9046269.1 hypothetical protein PR001_g4640 [Phytophthora rubi]